MGPGIAASYPQLPPVVAQNCEPSRILRSFRPVPACIGASASIEKSCHNPFPPSANACDYCTERHRGRLEPVLFGANNLLTAAKLRPAPCGEG